MNVLSCDGRGKNKYSPNPPRRVRIQGFMPPLHYTRNRKQWHTTNSTASAPTNATYLVASELYPEESLGLRVVELVVPPEVARNRTEAIVICTAIVDKNKRTEGIAREVTINTDPGTQ